MPTTERTVFVIEENDDSIAARIVQKDASVEGEKKKRKKESKKVIEHVADLFYEVHRDLEGVVVPDSYRCRLHYKG